jgi:hypothetical protein
MKNWGRRVTRAASVTRTQFFVALTHSLAVTCISDRCWTVSVDGVTVQGTFGSQAEAWEAGVRAADSHERLRPRVG